MIGNGDGCGGRALVVEDDEPLRALLAELVADAGLESVLAGSAEEARAVVGAEPPRLVVLDVALPGSSGYELCRWLRERYGDALPILFVSGARTEAHDRVAGLLVGADDYLCKPFAPDELVARVRALLRRGAHAAGRVDGPPELRLTARELEVRQLLARGLSQAAIASALVISSKTVATHIERILGKLGVHSRAEAVALAYRRALVSID